ncbi:OB-fold domain-containing protein, partial [Phytoactinopolyspora endophytica]
MITFVRGQVAGIRPTEAVLDVGGVGLALQCTPSTTA